MDRGSWGWSGMDDVSWGRCSQGRVPARNRAGLGTVVGYGSPRRRSDMSGVGRVFPGARVGTECMGLESIKGKGSQLRAEGGCSLLAHLCTRVPGTHLSGFTALSFFLGLKNKK